MLAPPAAADADPSRSTWRRNLALALLFGGFLWHSAAQRDDRLLEINRDLISCTPPEIHDLINVFQFTTSDLQQIYVRTMQRYRNGLVALDDFAQIVREQVEAVKARRAAAREQRARERATQQYQDDRAEVLKEMEIERLQARATAGDPEAAAALPSLLSSLSSFRAAASLAETLRDRAAAADELESHADGHADNKFHAIDTYVFFRTTAPKTEGLSLSFRSGPSVPGVGRGEGETKKLMDVRDLMVGLGNVIFDHADLSARFAERQGQKNIPVSLDQLQANWSARDIESFTRDPRTKLHWAFRVADEDRDGRISFAQMEALLARLIRTGHIKPESLLRARSALPPPAPSAVAASAPSAMPSSPSFLPFEYDVASAPSLARDYWALIQQWRRAETLEQIKLKMQEGTVETAQQTALAAAPSASAASASRSSPVARASPTAAASSSSAALDLSPVYTPSATVSYPEFLAASVHFTVTSDGDRGAAFWYLQPPGPTGASQGAVAKWRRKWAERSRRLWNNVPTTEENEQIEKNIMIILASN